jgi:hypothetical protein
VPRASRDRSPLFDRAGEIRRGRRARPIVGRVSDRAGGAHRGRELRGIGAFDFEANALLAPNHKEIELSAAVGAPEKALVGMSAKLSDGLLQECRGDPPGHASCETLEGRAGSRRGPRGHVRGRGRASARRIELRCEGPRDRTMSSSPCGRYLEISSLSIEVSRYWTSGPG